MRHFMTSRPMVHPDQSMRTASAVEHQRNGRQKNKVEEKASSSSLTWGLTIISSISLMLTLLGYGVAMAAEITFGMGSVRIFVCPKSSS